MTNEFRWFVRCVALLWWSIGLLGLICAADPLASMAHLLVWIADAILLALFTAETAGKIHSAARRAQAPSA